MKTTLLLSVLCAVMAAAASQACGTCATDEFCNITTSTACQCNSTLYPFVRGAAPSPNLTCTGAKFNIQVSKCWLEANGYNTSDIRLNGTDSGCFAAREVVDGKSEVNIHYPVTSSLCNTVPAVNGSYVSYSNQLYIFAKTYPIQTTNDVVMNISCSYPLNINITLNVTLHPVLGSTIISSPTANGSYVAIMMAFTDDTYNTPLSESANLQVEDNVYISVFIPDLDANSFKLKVVNIYASPTESSSQKYYLLQNGCPAKDVSADQLSVKSNGNATESRFAMKVFKIASSANVYLYADLALCTANCTTTCSSRSISRDSPDIAGRVSIYLDAADTNSILDASSASGFSMPWTLSALISSWILMKLM